MKEKATSPVRVYPSTRKRLKVKAAKFGWSLAEVIDYAEKTMANTVPFSHAKK